MVLFGGAVYGASPSAMDTRSVNPMLTKHRAHDPSQCLSHWLLVGDVVGGAVFFLGVCTMQASVQIEFNLRCNLIGRRFV